MVDAGPKTCSCGQTIEPILVTRGTFTPPICIMCNEARGRRILRAVRKAYVRDANAALGRRMPDAYRKAHLGQLSRPLAAHLLSPGQGVVLWGGVGTGKTYALCAVLRHLTVQGRRCTRVTYNALLDRIRAGYSSNLSEDDIMKPVMTCQYLFLEDVGTTTKAMESDFSQGIFLRILDQRLEAGLPMYVTTNRSFESLGQVFDERVRSRLQLLTWIKLKGQDRRTNHGK